MNKKAYKYNPDSLHFEPIDKGCKGKIFRFILYVLGGFICAFVLYTLYISNFDTIKEQKLLKKNQLLLSQYEQLDHNLSRLESELQEIASTDDYLYRAMLGKTPLGEDIRNAGIGGSDRYEQFEKYQNYNVLRTATQNVEILLNKLKIQEKSFNEVINEVQEHQLILKSKPSIQPVSVKDFKRISSEFGYRFHPVHGKKMMHHGLDFAGPVGTKIYATGDGIVEIAHRNQHGYGNEVIIEHYGGYKTRYAHLQSILVKKDQKIKRGQVIGLMGNTGISTGPHLHYEVLVNNQIDDPSKYYFNNLSVDEYEQIVKFSLQN
jgi:murein DD-endopeptidase MepM/ murein hydrolase activator NlpD